MKFIYPTGSFEKIVNKDKKNGYAGLDEKGLIKLTELKNIDFDNLSDDVNNKFNFMWVLVMEVV